MNLICVALYVCLFACLCVVQYVVVWFSSCLVQRFNSIQSAVFADDSLSGEECAQIVCISYYCAGGYFVVLK